MISGASAVGVWFEHAVHMTHNQHADSRSWPSVGTGGGFDLVGPFWRHGCEALPAFWFLRIVVHWMPNGT